MNLPIRCASVLIILVIDHAQEFDETITERQLEIELDTFINHYEILICRSKIKLTNDALYLF